MAWTIPELRKFLFASPLLSNGKDHVVKGDDLQLQVVFQGRRDDIHIPVMVTGTMQGAIDHWFSTFVGTDAHLPTALLRGNTPMAKTTTSPQKTDEKAKWAELCKRWETPYLADSTDSSQIAAGDPYLRSMASVTLVTEHDTEAGSVPVPYILRHHHDIPTLIDVPSNGEGRWLMRTAPDWKTEDNGVRHSMRQKLVIQSADLAMLLTSIYPLEGQHPERAAILQHLEDKLWGAFGAKP